MSELRILIVGAGGHGQTVAEALLFGARSGAGARAIGFADDTPVLQGQLVLGLPVLGLLADVPKMEFDGVIVAIGNNAARKGIFETLRASGCTMMSVIHPAAIVASNARIGEGCYIGANEVIGVACEIGENTIVNGTGCLGHHGDIGAHVHIAPGVTAAGHVTIGDGTQIGTGANLIPGSVVGAWSMVMAGSLVSGAIAPHSLVGGVPGRVLRRLAGEDSQQED